LIANHGDFIDQEGRNAVDLKLPFFAPVRQTNAIHLSAGEFLVETAQLNILRLPGRATHHNARQALKHIAQTAVVALSEFLARDAGLQHFVRQSLLFQQCRRGHPGFGQGDGIHGFMVRLMFFLFALFLFALCLFRIGQDSDARIAFHIGGIRQAD
jgi:hypothetical protein